MSSPPLPSISLELFGCPHKSYCPSLLRKVPACFLFWLLCWPSIRALEPQCSLSVAVWCSYLPRGVPPIAPLLLKLLLLGPTRQSLVMVPLAWTPNEPLQILQCFCPWPPRSGPHHKNFEDNYRPHPKVRLHTSSIMRVEQCHISICVCDSQKIRLILSQITQKIAKPITNRHKSQILSVIFSRPTKHHKHTQTQT